VVFLDGDLIHVYCSEILQKLGEIRGWIVEVFGWNTDMGVEVSLL
jgi:hypothetical protein